MVRIPTTFEMDGLFTEEDIRDRHTVVFQCQLCNKWTPHYDWEVGKERKYKPCSNCGGMAYDATSIKSIRTYNPETDNKRRIKKGR